MPDKFSSPESSPQLADLSLEWVETVTGFKLRSDLPEELHREQTNAASVLIPLFYDEREWHVLFIRRVANERDRHSGQVAFPGGRRDFSDTDEVSVAVREANEEIGLDTQDIEVVHVLPEYQTSSNFLVTPVVGIVPWPYPYQPQPTEVDRIFSIPLSWLAEQRNVELREKELNRDDVSAILKVVYYNRFDGEVLWGASARMTVSLLSALHRGDIDLDRYKNRWQKDDLA